MSEPVPQQEPQSAQTDAPPASALEAAFEKPTALPFFDLDIALIRRAPAPTTKTAAAPTVAKSAVPEISRERKAPEISRERKALDALDALLAERAAHKVVAPVAQFPKTQPLTVPEAIVPLPRMVEPRVMPMPAPLQASAGFVSPGFERVPAAKPGVESHMLVGTGLVQAAQTLAAQAPDLLSQVKLQQLRQALAAREMQLTRQATIVAKPDPVAAPLPDDLPWGHVTFRLAIM